MNTGENKLLTRDQFRDSCLKRDRNRCVVCHSQDNLSVHHIMTRKLWQAEHEFGGYFKNNGVVLCEIHHIEAEKTTLSCKELRTLAGITETILPEQLTVDEEYDTFGNIILANGNRLKGELFYEEQCQKILQSVMHLFTPYVKFPRIYHLPWSPGASSDDKFLKDTKAFEGREVVVTAKLDGESASGYPDGYYHARSISYEAHPSRSLAKQIMIEASRQLPEGWHITAENCFAKHSIHYKNLEAYVHVICIWNDRNKCLSWSETEEWCELLGLKTVPVLYKGIWNEELVKGLFQPEYNGDPMEGYVARVSDEVSYGEFKRLYAKMVRKNHVTTSSHWKTETIVKNELRKQP